LNKGVVSSKEDFKIGAVSIGRGVCPLMNNIKLRSSGKRFRKIYRILHSLFSIFDSMHCTENPIYVFPVNETARPRSQFLNMYPGSVFLFSCNKIGRPILEYINRSQIHECGNWETELYNSVLEITRPQNSNSGIC
jgi:hypothetical protein